MLLGMDQLGKNKVRTLLDKSKDGRQPAEVYEMKRPYELLSF
jgi:hypothetical protein